MSSTIAGAILIAEQRNLIDKQKLPATPLTKLPPGSRITEASDDADGLAVSEKLSVQLPLYQERARSASDEPPIVRNAEARLNQATNFLIHMHGLAMQPSSHGVDANERVVIQTEAQKLPAPLDCMATAVEINRAMNVDAKSLLALPVDLGVDAATSQATLQTIDDAINTISRFRAHLRMAAGGFVGAVTTISQAIEAEQPSTRQYTVPSRLVAAPVERLIKNEGARPSTTDRHRDRRACSPAAHSAIRSRAPPSLRRQRAQPSCAEHRTSNVRRETPRATRHGHQGAAHAVTRGNMNHQSTNKHDTRRNQRSAPMPAMPARSVVRSRGGGRAPRTRRDEASRTPTQRAVALLACDERDLRAHDGNGCESDHARTSYGRGAARPHAEGGCTMSPNTLSNPPSLLLHSSPRHAS